MAKQKATATVPAPAPALVQDTVLEYIAAETASKGFAFVDPNHEAVQKHLASGAIEVNHEVKNEHGHVAARIVVPAAIPAPLQLVPSPVEKVKPTYEILADIPLIPAKRGVTKEESYPFSKLEIGQSFFVGVDENHPEPWLTFPSTVSSATRRFANEHPTKTRTDKNGVEVPVLIPTRKFVLRRVTAGQKYSNGFVEPLDGVRVFRVPLKVTEEV